MAPFLTVLTRHLPGRAALLERNMASLRAQTDPDYVQMVLTDTATRGWSYAHQMLIGAALNLAGRYVLILDDDDLMEAADGIAALKLAAGTNPPLILFRGQHAELGVLPRTWPARPSLGDIGCFDYILRADVFQRCVTARAESEYAHDYYIVAKAFDAHEAEAIWLDKVICAADARRLGAAA